MIKYNLYYIILKNIWSYVINTDLVIFDLDGTLCDTFDDIYLSIKYSLDYFGINNPTQNEVKSFIGDGLLKLVERTLNHSNQITLLDDVMSLFMSYYKNHCTDSTLLFPGMDYVIMELYKSDIPMSVVSNKAVDLVKIILDELEISHYFKYIFGGDSFNEKKPNPYALNFILQQLNIYNPSNSIMVGDSDNDVLAGKQAGMITFFCSYGYSSLYKSKSDYTVDTPIQILDIIRKI